MISLKWVEETSCSERCLVVKKSNISPEKAKLISTLLISIIFMFIVLSLSSIYTKKMLKDAEEEYFSSIHTTMEAYTKIISLQLNDYIHSMQVFYLDKTFDNPDPESIYEFIIKNDYKIPEDFLELYYVLPDGTLFTSNNYKTHVEPEKHLGLVKGNDLAISEFRLHPKTGDQIFCIEKTIYKEGKIAGAIGASVFINKFIERTTDRKVGNKESYMLLDKYGVFLVHPDPEIIGLTYEPQDKRYDATSTINLAKNPPATLVAQTSTGDLAYLVTAKIPESGWTLSLKISMNEIDEIYKPEKKNEIAIIIISIVFVICLVLAEAKILDFFQRKQLIATVYDPLTNLWTRQRFETEANKMLRNSRSKFMLIEADIRGFKFINQNYGEEAADNLILHYSKMLAKAISGFHAIIGRGFADHFYLFIKINSVHKAMSVFKQEMEKFAIESKSYEIPFFPKFGISFLKPDSDINGNKIQGLIGQASFAKSTIKDNLLTQYSVYNSKLLEKINEEQFIENHMQQALDDREFFVMYQPKISLADDKIVGAEALVRWNSPKLGLMSPDQFIPLFERNGFITKLDYFVYEEVFKFIQKRLYKDLPIVPISVNMSRNHNKPEKFMHDFMELFTKYSIPPQLVQIEILERSVMDNTTLHDITEKLHKEGFSVAMDDFGSGESSLNMLTKIPVDVLKFDREFLHASTDSEGRIDKKSEKFIHILIDLSKSLEKQTVFEGVETQAQRDFLRSINCDQAQGFFYSKPLSEQDFVQFIKLHS